jgi:hypothetical protein
MDVHSMRAPQVEWNQFALLRWFCAPLLQSIQAVVSCDCIQPGTESGVSAKGIQPTKRQQENLLSKIKGPGRIPCHAGTPRLHAHVVTAKEFMEKVVKSGLINGIAQEKNQRFVAIVAKLAGSNFANRYAVFPGRHPLSRIGSLKTVDAIVV